MDQPAKFLGDIPQNPMPKPILKARKQWTPHVMKNRTEVPLKILPQLKRPCKDPHCQRTRPRKKIKIDKEQ